MCTVQQCACEMWGFVDTHTKDLMRPHDYIFGMFLSQNFKLQKLLKNSFDNDPKI